MRRLVLDLIGEKQQEVKRLEENSVDTWNFLLQKEDHVLMMMIA